MHTTVMICQHLCHAYAACVCLHACDSDLQILGDRCAPFVLAKPGSCIRTMRVAACMGVGSANTWSWLRTTIVICQH